MASVETQELFEKLKDRMINIVNLSSRLASFVSWLPMEIENNVLVDSYTEGMKYQKHIISGTQVSQSTIAADPV